LLRIQLTVGPGQIATAALAAATMIAMLTALPPYPPIAALCMIAKTPFGGTLPITAWADEAQEAGEKGQN
jgi:hypothetical protein